LENTIFRAVVLCDGAALDVCDFPQIAAAMGVETLARQNSYAPAAGGESAAPVAGRPTTSPYSLSMTGPEGHIRRFEEMEAQIIKTAIARYEGHMSEVARRLGIGRSTLYRKLKEFGLEPDMANEPMAKVAEDTAEPVTPPGTPRKSA
jgi:DNA-binding NtrC family response regulator